MNKEKAEELASAWNFEFKFTDWPHKNWLVESTQYPDIVWATISKDQFKKMSEIAFESILERLDARVIQLDEYEEV
jgi:hypothetical protein